MNEKDMMERYIYEVTKRVSQKARKEIKLELQTLIEDMCEEEEMTMETNIAKDLGADSGRSIAKAGKSR